MLFLGTEKYPDEKTYTAYLHEHSGICNAYTTSTHTTYLFQVGEAYLEEVLDMFAQFFIAPLFTESCVSREVEAVESEHAKDVVNDSWRMKRLGQLSAHPNHPLHKFDGGSAKTLQVHADLREQVKKFWEEHYSANLMTLIIVGKESLEELEKMARDKFSAIKDKQLVPKNWSDDIIAFDASRLAKRVSAVPIADKRSLTIRWPLPVLTNHYKSQPLHYIGHILGHEGKGSLFSYLRGQGWADSLMAGGSNSIDHSTFDITVLLTPGGLENVDKVVDAIYAFIVLFKHNGISQTLFEEIQMMGTLGFRFMDKSEPFNWFFRLSFSVPLYPLHYLLASMHLVEEYDPKTIGELVNLLTPENSIVFLVAKETKEAGSIAHALGDSTPNLVEEHYNMDYRTDSLTEAQIQRWKTILNLPAEQIFAQYASMHVPNPNPFIPKNLDILEAPEGVKKDAPPTIVVDTPTLRVWHKQDQQFAKPRAYILFNIMSAIAYTSPLTVAKTKLFLEYLADDLNEFAYDTDVAGLKCAIVPILDGFTLEVSGYNDKIQVLLSRVLERFTTLGEFDLGRFERIRTKIYQSYSNLDFQQAYLHANYQFTLFTESPRWNVQQYKECVASLKAEQVSNWWPQLLENLWIDGLVTGNIAASDAIKVAQLVQDTLKPSALMPGQWAALRAVRLDPGVQHWVQFEAPNPVETNSATLNLYQVGFENIHTIAIMELLDGLISSNAYETLRTKEQLGYIVQAQILESRHVLYYFVIVQGAKHDPVHVDARIESWLGTVSKTLTEISESDFKDVQTALATAKRVKPTSLKKEGARHWTTISITRDYDFARLEKEAKEIESLTLKDIITWWDENVAPDAPKRAKLSSQVWPPAHKPHLPPAPSTPINLVSDPFDFKATMPAFGVRLMAIPPKKPAPAPAPVLVALSSAEDEEDQDEE